MIGVDEAKQIIREKIHLLPLKELPLQQAAGMILAADVYATVDIPPFAQSAMDGYAISYNGWQTHKELTLTGEIAAGTSISANIASDEAVRIFTGAAVPDGADTVVMQEKTKTDNSALIIEDANLVKGANVRDKGSEITAGTLALEKGTLLTPAAIGFLANIGFSAVSVYPKPRLTIIVTGNELQDPGKQLGYGQVYESNSFALSAALQGINITDIKVVKAQDNLEILSGVMAMALIESDVILVTGGVSAGDYDFVLQAAKQCRVTQIFHKVKQRPGKPLYFGMKEGKAVFGLPGNPSSVLTCFYEYALPALEQMMSRKNSVRTIHAPIGKTFKKTAALTFFLKGYYDGRVAFPLDAQESYRMSSFARANCLIKIEEAIMEQRQGESTEVHLFSYNN